MVEKKPPNLNKRSHAKRIENMQTERIQLPTTYISIHYKCGRMGKDGGFFLQGFLGNFGMIFSLVDKQNNENSINDYVTRRVRDDWLRIRNDVIL